jgi:hypothetical protein
VEAPEALKNLKAVFPSRSRELIKTFLKSEADQKLPTWRVEQLIKFIGLIDWFAEDLQKAFEQERVMTVSWLARNLLEIFIWVRYCNLSEMHAKRFHEDVMRDFYGYCKALEGLNVWGDGELKDSIDNLLKGYSNFAKSQGIAEVADDFTRVSKAAEELGETRLFLSMNKIFSKLAHPTALAMDAALREVGRKQYRDLFVVDATEMAIRSLEVLEDFNAAGYNGNNLRHQP